MTIGPKLRELLAGVMPAALGTKRSDGSVQLNPVWFELAGDEIVINGGPTRGWLRHAQRDKGRVTLLFVDPKNFFRWAQVQGRIVATAEEGAGEHIDRLSQRYTGGAYRGPKTGRLIVRIAPYRVTGSAADQP